VPTPDGSGEPPGGSRLRGSLFNEFGFNRLSAAACENAYRLLFERIGGVPDELVCSTTNYDRSLEIAFQSIGLPSRTGFTPDPLRTPTLDPRGLGEFEPGHPSVLYLYGAVGWYVRDDGSIISTPADAAHNPTLGRPAVFYPDPQKEVERTETAALWQAFLEALDNATHVLVVGHSLNDPHLLGALRAASDNIRGALVGVVVHALGAETTPEAQEAISKLQGLIPDRDTGGLRPRFHHRCTSSRYVVER
jgi:hypothetical protein